MWPIVTSWTILGAFETWFAYQSAARPEASTIAFEWVCLAVLAASQVRFARSRTGRSPLWAGALGLTGSALSVWTLPAIGAALVLVGVATALASFARATARWSSTMPGAIVATTLFSLGRRAFVLGQLGNPATVFDEVWPAPPGAASTALPPLVLITVDTLRADAAERMGSLRWFEDRGGAVWHHGMSASSWTLPAMASAMTGVMPGRHGAFRNYDWHTQGISPDVPTLAEVLAARGYRTAAIATNVFLGRSTGFDRGFQEFFHVLEHPPSRLLVTGFTSPVLGVQDGSLVADLATRWLGGAPPSGYFLWVHFLDVHSPYQHADTYAGPWSGHGLLDGPMDSAAVTQLHQAYGAQVDYVDTQIQRVLAELDARHFVESGGLVMLAGDHGEELFDHGRLSHGHSHHGEVVDVPIAVAGGGTTGTTGGVASLLDVAATFRATAGLPADGIDLREGVPEGRIATAHGNLQFRLDRSATNGRERVIVFGSSRPPERYDLVQDPRERHALLVADDDPLLAAAREDPDPPSDEARAVAVLDSDALGALGYVE